MFSVVFEWGTFHGEKLSKSSFNNATLITFEKKKGQNHCIALRFVNLAPLTKDCNLLNCLSLSKLDWVYNWAFNQNLSSSSYNGCVKKLYQRTVCRQINAIKVVGFNFFRISFSIHHPERTCSWKKELNVTLSETHKTVISNTENRDVHFFQNILFRIWINIIITSSNSKTNNKWLRCEIKGTCKFSVVQTQAFLQEIASNLSETQ